MMALTQAALARWQPEASVFDNDEESPPTFGDEDLDEFLDLVQDMGDLAIFQGIASFFSIPDDVVKSVLTDALREVAVGPASAKSALVAPVVRKRQGDPR